MRLDLYALPRRVTETPLDSGRRPRPRPLIKGQHYFLDRVMNNELQPFVVNRVREQTQGRQIPTGDVTRATEPFPVSRLVAPSPETTPGQSDRSGRPAGGRPSPRN